MKKRRSSKKILSILATIISFVSFFLFDIPSSLNSWYYAVYLTPKIISVNKSDWATKKSIQIVNNNPYPIYAVQLKISEITLNSNIDDIQIKPQPYIIETKFSSSTDMNGLVTSENLNGKKWRRSVIYVVNSHSKIDIQLTIPPAPTREKFKLEITDFRKESTNIFESGNTTLIPFYFKD